jgi:hypothetical protein
MGFDLLPERKSLSQIRKAKTVKGRSLVPSKKVEENGVKFDSLAEKEYLEVLRSDPQVVTIWKNPVVEMGESGIKWVLDYRYLDKAGIIFYVDVKGMRVTETIKLKILAWSNLISEYLAVVKQDPDSREFLRPEVYKAKKAVMSLKLIKPGEIM